MNLTILLLWIIIVQLIVVQWQNALNKDRLERIENEISSIAVPRRKSPL